MYPLFRAGKKNENGFTHQSAIGIDTPEDLNKAQQFLNKL